MKGKVKEIAAKVILPPVSVFIIISATAFPLVSYVLIREMEGATLSFIAYILSAYALVLVIARVVTFLKHGRVRKIIPSKDVRLLFSLGASTFISAGHGIFLILSGLYSTYLFSQLTGVYYILLAVLRYSLLKNMKKDIGRQELKAAPWLLLAANIIMAGVIAVQIGEGRGTAYPYHFIYGAALYAFYMLILSSRNIRKDAHSENEALRMARSLAFSVSLITLFSLQLSMLSTFGEDDFFKLMMNIITGVLVVVMTISIPSVILIRQRRSKGKETA